MRERYRVCCCSYQKCFPPFFLLNLFTFIPPFCYFFAKFTILLLGVGWKRAREQVAETTNTRSMLYSMCICMSMDNGIGG